MACTLAALRTLRATKWGLAPCALLHHASNIQLFWQGYSQQRVHQKLSCRGFSTEPPKSSRQPTPREAEVLQNLRTIIHPGNPDKKDLLSSHVVKGLSEKEGVVTVVLGLDQHYVATSRKIIEVLKQQLPWVTEVKVTMEPGAPRTKQQPPQPPKPNGLAKVKKVLAVSSCKGGVGKSTVAVNVAYALAKNGAKVGILDADVYGPSLPVLTSPPDRGTIRADKSGLAIPAEYEGVKLMSFGFVATEQNSGAILRGPIATKLITQLVTETMWGELDYLVIDMPPGTGDIQITLAQLVKMDGALVVTTPQKLSYIDVVKGLDMFAKVEVPVLGIIENMAYFTCGSCNTLHRPFGPGCGNRIAAEYGVRELFEIPMFEDISRSSDSGVPFVLGKTPKLQSVRETYGHMASTIDRIMKSDTDPLPVVRYESSSNEILVEYLSEEKRPVVKRLAPRTVRLQCSCAACVDEISNRKLLNAEAVPMDVKPLGIARKGNYAVAVHWSDGHASSIYSFRRLLAL